MSLSSSSLRRRARTALLTRALLRRESLITLAITSVLASSDLAPWPGWQPQFWLIGGAVALAALVGGQLFDEDSARQALGEELAARLDIDSIRNSTSREQLRRALEYSVAMQRLLDLHQGALQESLRQTVVDVDTWIGHMVSLAQHIDTFEDNELISRDLHAVPRRIGQARKRLEREQDPELRVELQGQIDQLQQQLDNLNAIVSSGRRAVLRLENTLSSLGTVHAQMTLLGTRKVDSGSARQLRQEIRDEVNELQDTIEAMDEVQAGHARLR